MERHLLEERCPSGLQSTTSTVLNPTQAHTLEKCKTYNGSRCCPGPQCWQNDLISYNSHLPELVPASVVDADRKLPLRYNVDCQARQFLSFTHLKRGPTFRVQYLLSTKHNRHTIGNAAVVLQVVKYTVSLSSNLVPCYVLTLTLSRNFPEPKRSKYQQAWSNPNKSNHPDGKKVSQGLQGPCHQG